MTPEIITTPHEVRVGVIRQPENVVLASGDSIQFSTALTYHQDGSVEVTSQDYRVILQGMARETQEKIGP